MSSGHAPFPPSAAKRWMTCTGSFALGLQAPPEKESEYAAEGTRLHDVAKAVLTESGETVAADDLRALKPYLDYARMCMREADSVSVETHIEHSMLLGGTADLLLFYDKLRMLEVVDLKSGGGIMVDPENNHQMLTYAYMAALKRVRNGSKYPERFRLTVVQPPDENKPVKTWDTTMKRVLQHGEEVEEAIQTAITGQGELVPGDHCRFCRAKPICPKLRGEMVEALGGPLPGTMTVAALAQWLDRADRMEQFIVALRETGHAVALHAQELGTAGIPGWKLKPKRATRQWADEDKVLELARKRKIKIFQDKLLSPAMAEKAHPNLPQELREQIVAVSSGLNLVRMTEAEAEAQKLVVKKPDEATKMERLMANMSLAKLRR